MSGIQSRRIKKISEKTLWINKVMFKKKEIRETNKYKHVRNDRKGDSPKWVDGILMVPHTTNGALCRSLRDAEVDLRKNCTTAVKVLEDTGTQVRKLLSGDPWASNCPRKDCIPCTNKESKISCNRRNIVYLSTCTLC